MYLLRVEGSDFDSLVATWVKLDFPTPLPYLNSHICLVFKKKYLLLIGGDRSREDAVEEAQNPIEEHGKEFSSLIYRVQVLKRSVTILPLESNDFKPRIAHSGVVDGDQIYVFGGLEKQKSFNGQLLKLTIKRAGGTDGESASEPVINSKDGSKDCKHCAYRIQNAFTKQVPAIQDKPPLVLQDFSSLENKVKRRLM